MGASYGRTAKMVALRKESVDRNPPIWTLTTHKILSLSARRAWIEIVCRAFCYFSFGMSLSARRAWIEMFLDLVRS